MEPLKRSYKIPDAEQVVVDEWFGLESNLGELTHHVDVVLRILVAVHTHGKQQILCWSRQLQQTSQFSSGYQQLRTCHASKVVTDKRNVNTTAQRGSRGHINASNFDSRWFCASGPACKFFTLGFWSHISRRLVAMTRISL